MNEFATIMHGLGIKTHEVIAAAQTKWNFVPYKPGFVGGHCIYIDSLYLAFKAKRIGLNPDLILAARKVNDEMTQFMLKELKSLLLKQGLGLEHATIGIFGITYKENSKDTRNSLALKLIKELKASGFKIKVHDPMVDKNIIDNQYGLELLSWDKMNDLSAALILVGHAFYDQQGLGAFTELCLKKSSIMDLPNLFVEQTALLPKDIQYWSL